MGQSAIGVAFRLTLSNSLELALFDIPFLILFGWAVGQPMSMRFNLLETVLVEVCLFILAVTIRLGRSNYLLGCMFLGL